MKFVQPKASRIQEENVFKLVERIGRTCYKSENNITDKSCYDFVARMIKSKHFAMLEHGTIYCRVSVRKQDILNNLQDLFIPYLIVEDFSDLVSPIDPEVHINLDLVLNLSHLFNPRWKSKLLDDIKFGLFSVYSFYSDLFTGTKMEEIKHHTTYQMIDSVLFFNHPQHELNRFYSVHFLVDRGVSHELVRHRCAVAQESTRYCNYASDKFGNELTFITPSSWDSLDRISKEKFKIVCSTCEAAYLDLIKAGYSPQVARAELPNVLKTEVILTMSRGQWEHFIDLRSRGTTGAPHPDMKVVADQVLELFDPITENTLKYNIFWHDLHAI